MEVEGGITIENEEGNVSLLFQISFIRGLGAFGRRLTGQLWTPSPTLPWCLGRPRAATSRPAGSSKPAPTARMIAAPSSG